MPGTVQSAVGTGLPPALTGETCLLQLAVRAGECITVLKDKPGRGQIFSPRSSEKHFSGGEGSGVGLRVGRCQPFTKGKRGGD